MTISLEHAIRMIVEGKLEKNVNPARKVGPAGGDWEEASEDERTSKAKEAIVKSTATPGQKTVGEEAEELDEISAKRAGEYFDKKIKKVTSTSDKKNLAGVNLASKKLGGSAKVNATEETAVGTVERRKIENVGRPTSTRKALVKQNEIRKKIIDEQARRINTIQGVVAKKTKEEKDEINDKSAVEGVTKTIASPGTTPVVINPKLAKPGPNTAS